ncbi:MAG TPA: hypothetical protein PLY95_03155 [Candidatus Paceibacterota bacterium]|nr:hypothetical protein [Candidatus Paceibacterota bacterium]
MRIVRRGPVEQNTGRTLSNRHLAKNRSQVRAVFLYFYTKFFLIVFQIGEFWYDLRMEEEIQKLKQELDTIKERNNRVEGDKAWETSYFRVILISLITYVLASITFYLIGNPNYFLNALIPTLGYFLSTQSLPFIKKWWINKSSRK